MVLSCLLLRLGRRGLNSNTTKNPTRRQHTGEIGPDGEHDETEMAEMKRSCIEDHQTIDLDVKCHAKFDMSNSGSASCRESSSERFSDFRTLYTWNRRARATEERRQPVTVKQPSNTYSPAGRARAERANIYLESGQTRGDQNDQPRSSQTGTHTIPILIFHHAEGRIAVPNNNCWNRPTPICPSYVRPQTPQAEKGTPKDIANRMKAKGLQKLKFYCQMCQSK